MPKKQSGLPPSQMARTAGEAWAARGALYGVDDNGVAADLDAPWCRSQSARLEQRTIRAGTL